MAATNSSFGVKPSFHIVVVGHWLSLKVIDELEMIFDDHMESKFQYHRYHQLPSTTGSLV